MATYSHYRSDQEWMEIITACRQSGLSDFHWCQTMPIQPVTTALPVAEPAKHIDKAHTIEIVLPGMSVLISNQADPALLAALMSAIR